MEEIELHSHIKMETAKGRTYGECVMDEIASIKMINGEFRTTLHIKEKPKRLKHLLHQKTEKRLGGTQIVLGVNDSENPFG